jgi:hypothetical protein
MRVTIGNSGSRTSRASDPQPRNNSGHDRDEKYAQILQERYLADVRAIGCGHQHQREGRAWRPSPYGGGPRQHAPAGELPSQRGARARRRDRAARKGRRLIPAVLDRGVVLM